MQTKDLLGGNYGINDDSNMSYEEGPSIEKSNGRNRRQNIEDDSPEDQDPDYNSEEEESDDENSESGLSVLDNEVAYFQSKIIYQRKALFYKNAILQSRQKCTNCLQFSIPLLGLCLIHVLSHISVDSIGAFLELNIFSPLPYFFGIDWSPISNIGDIIGIPIKMSTCDKWFMTNYHEDATQETKDYIGSNLGQQLIYNDWGMRQKTPDISEGMISSKNLLQSTCNKVNRTVPYFREFADVNDELGGRYSKPDEYLFEHLNNLANTTIEYSKRNFDDNIDVKALPDGLYTIKEANNKTLSYDSAVNDHHIWQYHKENGITKMGIWRGGKSKWSTAILRVLEGHVEATSLLNKAYIKHNFNDTTVQAGINMYPFTLDFRMFINKLEAEESTLLIPFCLCMGLPVFMNTIVLEKEKRLIETMKINGLLLYNYWIVNFAFDFLYYMAVCTVFYMFGTYILQMNMFIVTSKWLFLIIFVGWGLSQISFAFFLSVFLQKASTATIVGYGFSIYMMGLATLLNGIIYGTPLPMPWHHFLIPTFVFQRCMQWLTQECCHEKCFRSFNQAPGELRACMLFLYIQFFFYGGLAWYLNQVLPQSFGVRKKWNWICKMRKPGDQQFGRYDFDEIRDLEEGREQNDHPVYDYNQDLEDADSKAERNIVYNLDKADYYKYPLIIKDMRKVYPGFGGRAEKVATKNFSLRIKKGEMFGLLGPNGAGKTTLINMLTGMYPPTKGNAWVAGFDIKHQLETVQIQIGYCPQFDVLWDELTVREHLTFYSRVKGIPPHKEDEMVKQAIKDVRLEKFIDFQAKRLSGGMKRRLSVAISLVSEPKIIFLDEPSTGLDPENRRQLWDIFADLKGKVAIVLTTHSMEEADVLCNRIAIVNNGILRCVAPQVRLKSLYGGGYHLFINSMKQHQLRVQKKLNRRRMRKKRGQDGTEIRAHPSQIEEQEDTAQAESGDENISVEEIHKKIKAFVKQMLPTAEMITDFNGNFMYLIPNEGFSASEVYLQFESNKDRLKIADWGLSQSTLEDVFTKICEQNAGNND